MKIYDYKDESRDVKGKVRSIPTKNLADRETECDLRATTNATGLKERSQSDHSQPRRGNADDWEKHFQTTP